MVLNTIKRKEPNTYISELVYSAIENCHPNVKITELLTVLFQKTPWLWSASELCRPSDRRFLAK
jgi:hypothetical protein